MTNDEAKANAATQMRALVLRSERILDHAARDLSFHRLVLAPNTTERERAHLKHLEAGVSRRRWLVAHMKWFEGCVLRIAETKPYGVRLSDWEPEETLDAVEWCHKELPDDAWEHISHEDDDLPNGREHSHWFWFADRDAAKEFKSLFSDDAYQLTGDADGADQP